MRILVLGFLLSFTTVCLIRAALKSVYYGVPNQLTENSPKSESREVSLAGEEPKIYCWVPIAATGIDNLVSVISSTWGRHCNLLMFTSEFEDLSRNIKGLNITFKQSSDLWNIIHPAWQYAYENHLERFEWFVKVDSDSYFSSDNFRILVKDINPDEYHYFGHTAYFAGHHREFNLGAGYAISRGTLRKLGPYLPSTQSGLSATEKCANWFSWAEDHMFSKCLRISGSFHLSESKDSHGRETFMAFKPLDNFLAVRRPNSTGWFWKNKPASTKFGVHCCSSRPVLFHQLKFGRSCYMNTDCSKMVLALEYLLYSIAVDPKPYDRN